MGKQGHNCRLWNLSKDRKFLKLLQKKAVLSPVAGGAASRFRP